MCRRVIQPIVTTELGLQFNLQPGAAPMKPEDERNVNPGQQLLTIRRGDPELEYNRAAFMRWGMGPAQRGRDLMYNARSETAAIKPSFRDAFHRRRCLVPVAGFFEFPATGAPVAFRTEQGFPAAMAGIWNPAQRDAFNPKHCVVLTAEPNALVAPHHHRMPVLLMEEDWQEWMEPATDASRLAQMLKPRDWPGVARAPR